MRIAIMGAGGVGTYFGARLAAAGEEVIFIARGSHLEALQAQGLSLQSPQGDLTLENVTATEDPKNVGVVDVVLVTVKLYSLEEACRAMGPIIGPETMIVPVQNGVSAADIVKSELGDENVVGGLVFVASFVVAPGKIEHKTELHQLVCGEIDGTRSDRVLAFCQAGQNAGFDAIVSENIELEIWKKFVNLAGMSPVTALSRQTIGAVQADPDLREIFRQSISEAVAIGQAGGVEFPPDIVEATVAWFTKVDPNTKNSMLLDLEAGKRMENEWISGEIVRLGRKYGVNTPFHDVAYAMLKPFANGM